MIREMIRKIDGWHVVAAVFAVTTAIMVVHDFGWVGLGWGIGVLVTAVIARAIVRRIPPRFRGAVVKFVVSGVVFVFLVHYWRYVLAVPVTILTTEPTRTIVWGAVIGAGVVVLLGFLKRR